MVLRLLREPRTGRPGPAARIIAVLIVVGLIGVAGPTLFVVLGRLLALLG